MSEITILDGGMGQELLARTGAKPTPMWSAQVMIDHPEAVRGIHDDYFAAGADIATTNTYSVQHDRLVLNDASDRFEELHRLACKLACDARDANGQGKVAGSLGPIGWSYRPDLAPSAENAAELYSEIVGVQNDMVDLFICETMSSIEQAKGALMGTATGNKPVWLGLSVSDEDGTKLRSNETLADIFPLLDEYKPEAVLVNCSIPEAVSKAITDTSQIMAFRLVLMPMVLRIFRLILVRRQRLMFLPHARTLTPKPMRISWMSGSQWGQRLSVVAVKSARLILQK